MEARYEGYGRTELGWETPKNMSVYKGHNLFSEDRRFCNPPPGKRPVTK